MDSTTLARPAPLACDECRRKHLRCKGGSPCPRCALDGLRCAYTPSRRGLARRRHGDSGARATPVPTVESTALTRVRVPASPPESLNTSESSPAGWSVHGHPSSNVPTSSPNGSSLATTDEGKLVTSYYNHFHEAHPVLVQGEFYGTQSYPHYLHKVVLFIGAQYAHASSVDLDNTTRAAMSVVDEQSTSSVQALLLYAIVLHALHRTHEAEDCLRRGAIIANRIGMHDPTFAASNATGNLVVEESYRRTWWELHTTEIYVAALHRRPTPSTALSKSSPLLPGLQRQDDEQVIGRSYQSFENRVFALVPQVRYPSLCYKIEAARIINRVLFLDPSSTNHASDTEAVDHAIASWTLHLPASEQRCLSTDGVVDEVLFQAHYLIACAGIFLHFPRSALPAKVPSANDIACARAQAVAIPSAHAAHHTAKAVAASKDIACLAALPCPMDGHSPFFVCGLVLGTVVQLAAATMQAHSPARLQQHRDHVVLMLGALGQLGTRWTVARNAVACLKAISQVIFMGPADPVTAIPQESYTIPAEYESFSNMEWFDMFTPDEMQTSMWNG